MVQKNSINKKIVIICGPTATGKTELSINLAKKLNSAIISADSMNVYKQLNIGTAKPTKEEQALVFHYLIDVVEPTESFSVGDYRELAKPIVDNLINNNKIPVICGGTGFYINSILYNLSYGNSVANLSARKYYFDLAEKNGNEYVYEILKVKDFLASTKIHPNDIKRVVRALEIADSGYKKSDFIDDLTPNYDYLAYYIDYDRKTLYQRIDLRVDKMFDNGLVEEVKGLVENYNLTFKNQSMQGIGYKEILPLLNGDSTLQQTKDLIKLNTRHYAKRQITFFKKLEKLKALKPDSADAMADLILNDLYK